MRYAGPEEEIRSRGFQPLEPYPGTGGVPWRCRCPNGHEVEVILYRLRAGASGCPSCGYAEAGRRRREAAEGKHTAAMRAAGFEPLEPYPGSGKPWRCRHLACGNIVTPRPAYISNGQVGCTECAKESRRAIFQERAGGAERAEADMRSVGLEPLEPYTNSGTPWRCRCTTCGHVGTPRLSYIRQLINAGTASGCASCNHKARGEQQRRAQAAQAESMMRAAGYEPLEPYDSASAPWHCRHLTCGEEVICDNYSPHLTTKRCQRVGTWAEANNVEIAYTPTNSSWLNRIEAQFTALRYFALDGTDHPTHKAQGSMIRRYIIWRNKNAADKRLKALVSRANAA